MSLILPSSSAPRPPGNPASSAAARNDAPAENAAGSFGEALSRSLEPTAEIAGKRSDKAALPRRQADTPKTDPQELINTMALSFVPLESRIVKTVSNGDTGAAATATATPADAASGSRAAALTGLSVRTPGAADASVTAAEVAPDTIQQTALASAWTPAPGSTNPKDAGQTVLTAVNDQAPSALAPVIAGQSAAPDTGFRDQSAKSDNQAGIELTGMRDASVIWTPTEAHRAGKTPAASASTSTETEPTPLIGSQAPDTAALSASAALPTVSVMAAAPGPAIVSSTPAPEAASTASLAPEVGSGEWGKALGQQVIHMGQAGHQVAELQLNPPGLGPLKVTLSMSDQQMQATFVSAHASVRVAIEAALPQLRSTLADNGINLGDTSVSSGSQQQTAFNERASEQPNPRGYRDHGAPDLPASAARHAAAPMRPRSGSSVDTYA